MEQILDFAKRLLLPHLYRDGIYLDGTMGTGQDTLFLARFSGSSKVYSFDIQPNALNQTEQLLKNAGVSAHLILDSHANLDQHVHERLDAAIFNFGYLPNGDKTITTKADTSLEAVAKTLLLLKENGILILVCYPGHEEGSYEAEKLESWCRSLSGKEYNVIKYDFINKRHPPFILAIEHRIPTPKQKGKKVND